ncbi:MAG: hypothetical protein JO041_06725 [Acidobacteria bacterium]|nr:hypothetical protein [Acidobacteriota bacterium]
MRNCGIAPEVIANVQATARGFFARQGGALQKLNSQVLSIEGLELDGESRTGV